MLSLYIVNFFLNKFIFVNNKSQYNYFFIYIKIILSLYLINIVIAKTIIIFIIKKDKDQIVFYCAYYIYTNHKLEQINNKKFLKLFNEILDLIYIVYNTLICLN